MKGFTLLEMMIAVAITAVLVVGVSTATLGLTRSAEGRREEARRQERRARAVELLSRDWRGRLRLISPAERAPAGTSILALSTSSDAIGGGARAVNDVRWSASERGLTRKEGGQELRLLEEPVALDAWTGQAWTRDIRGTVKALRITFGRPFEAVVISR